LLSLILDLELTLGGLVFLSPLALHLHVLGGLLTSRLSFLGPHHPILFGLLLLHLELLGIELGLVLLLHSLQFELVLVLLVFEGELHLSLLLISLVFQHVPMHLGLGHVGIWEGYVSALLGLVGLVVGLGHVSKDTWGEDEPARTLVQASMVEQVVRIVVIVDTMGPGPGLEEDFFER
jgi:hypothetical protein